jgi:methionyl-tRNA formyltransferase
MGMLRVVFFGNSEGAFSNRHFAALRDVRCELAAVVDVPPERRTTTNSRTPEGQGFAGAARARGIPVWEPAKPNTPEFVEVLRATEPDLFLAVGYLNRLGADLLRTPRLLAANFHASLLPAYRGLHPVFRTLRAGERWAGLTCHVLDAGLDTGDILYQVRLQTRRNDSVAGLYDRIMARSVGLVGRLIGDAEAGKLKGRPQGVEGASYFSSVDEEDYRVDWRRPAEQLRRWICATPGCCYCDMAGERIYFEDADLAGSGSDQQPGTLVGVGRKRCVITAGEGALGVGRIRTRDGTLPAADWCRQRGLRAGIQIGATSATDLIS